MPVLALQKNKWGMAAIVAAIGVTVSFSRRFLGEEGADRVEYRWHCGECDS